MTKTIDISRLEEIGNYSSDKERTIDDEYYCSENNDIENYDTEQQIRDYISRHALVSMGVLENMEDSSSDDLIETGCIYSLLSCIQNGDVDSLIVAKTTAMLALSGYRLQNEDLFQMVELARKNCKMELFAMSFAYDLLNNEDPANVLKKIHFLLD